MATRKVKVMDEPKAGLQSSEFLLTALVVVAASVLASLGVIAAEDWRWAVSLTGGAYAISRGLAKL